MSKLNFQLVSPERVVRQGEADSISCPTTLGEITILPGHAALVAELVAGEIIIRQNKEEFAVHVDGGFTEVKSGNSLIILADAALHAGEIDEAAAQQARERAQQALRESKTSDEEYALAAANLEKSLSRLRFVRKHSHNKSRPVTSEGILSDQ